MSMYIYEHKPNLVTVNKLHFYDELSDCYREDMVNDTEIINQATYKYHTEQVVFMRNSLEDLEDFPLDHFDSWYERILILKGFRNEIPDFEEGDTIALDVKLRCMNSNANIADSLNRWFYRSMDWLKKTFDTAPDGFTNIVSVVLYRYENEAIPPMLRAIIVPIDKDGELGADTTMARIWNEESLNDSYMELHNVEYKTIPENGERDPLAKCTCITAQDLMTNSFGFHK